MADFIGTTVKVTLKNPPNTIVHGRVREVIAGQTLGLENVFFPSSGQRWGNWTVQGTAIADLEVIASADAEKAAAPLAPAALPQQAMPLRSVAPALSGPPPALPNQAVAQQPPKKEKSDFVDPAILSMSRSPAPKKVAELPADNVPVTPIKSMMEKAASALPPKTNSPFIGEPTPTKPTVAPAPAGANNSARASDSRKKKGKKGKPQDPPPIMNSDVSRNGNDMSANVKRGKGWRQTPLLQPSPQPSLQGRVATENGNTRKSRRQQRETQDQNGWATEDATDIQGMDDFDFEANHKLFDKKTVFDELRQGDTTADEDRLVGHNRLARPGTHGGKNLHPTENVLSPKLAAEDVSSDADTEMNFQTGRSSSRHSVTKRQPSRQNSAVADGRHPLAASVSSDRGLARSVSSLATRTAKPISSIASATSRPDRVQSPHSINSSKANGSPHPGSRIQGPHFAMNLSRTPCPVLHPNALETLENAAVARFGLTHDAITESAARNVAELAMSMFDGGESSRRGSRANTLRGSVTVSTLSAPQTLPVIVVLAGDHATGARAVAAARHLVTRNTKIIIAEAQYESPTTQDEQMAKQTTMLKKMLRNGAAIKRGTWRKASNYIKNLSGPAAVIIDALLAGTTYSDLPAEAQQEAREMIDWANRSRAPVLSIGCPSGASGLDGSATIVEGEPLAVRPDRVLALGMPVLGLLEAMKGGERWDVSVADIGINIALKADEAVAFGGSWTSRLGFMEG